MKFMKYTSVAVLFLSIGVAHANSSGKGDKIISQEDYYNVPIPAWMNEANNVSADIEIHSGTIRAKAFSSSGHVSPSVTTVSGNISGDIYNDTNNNQYYTFDEFVCVTNLKCNERKTTVGLLPGGSHHHDETLFLSVQINKPGTYQNATSCKITGAGNAKIVDYAPVTITK